MFPSGAPGIRIKPNSTGRGFTIEGLEHRTLLSASIVGEWDGTWTNGDGYVSQQHMTLDERDGVVSGTGTGHDAIDYGYDVTGKITDASFDITAAIGDQWEMTGTVTDTNLSGILKDLYFFNGGLQDRAIGSFSFTRVQQKVDLSAEFIDPLPPDASPSDTISTTFGISDAGPGKATGTISANFQLVPTGNDTNNGLPIDLSDTAAASITDDITDPAPIPIRFAIPKNTPQGTYTVVGTLSDGGGITDTDTADKTFSSTPIHVLGASLEVTSISWKGRSDNLDVKYAVTGGTLAPGADVAVYWASGTEPSQILGSPFFEVPANSSPGTYAIVVPGTNLGTPPEGTTNIVLVADPNHVLSEAPSSNSLSLQPIDLGPSFAASGFGVTLDPTLQSNFMNYARFLVGHNAIISPITLNDGVRNPAQAHVWSTAYSIIRGSVPLSILEALPSGRDLDGNMWFDTNWALTPPNKAGKQARRTASQIMALARQNARAVAIAAGRSNPSAVAAEGYPTSDPRRRPNTYRGTSKHCLGLAIDATINTETGTIVDGVRLGSGGASDNALNQIAARFGLARPVHTERWHYEMG